MSARYESITFDCYGTLIDWNCGIADAFEEIAHRYGVAIERDRIVTLYHEVEPLVEATYCSYREVLATTAREVAKRLGWVLNPAEAEQFAQSVPRWPPFSDTNPALERLRAAGYQIGILSNVDDDILSATCQHFRVPIDMMVTAQYVRSYKPAHGHFLAARERLSGRRWLHAAQSHMHDVVPATALGVPVVWVNRLREPLPTHGPAPLAEVATLSELADWLGV